MKIPNEYRIRKGFLASDDSNGANGAFLIPFESTELFAVVSDQMGWDHISVSKRSKMPSWKEMCFIKNLFFDETETVVQFHPKKTEYINNHPNCLHLWRKHDSEYELPPSIFVGFKELNLDAK